MADARPTTSVLADPQRLAALRATGLLRGAASDVLDRVARTAARLLGVPVALVSLVDRDEQWFPGLAGRDADGRHTPLSHSFCQHVVTSGAPLIVTDALTHPLVGDNRAIRDLGVRAYAGVPLTTANGQTLGSLCAIDTAPRQWTEGELDTIRDAAAAAMAEIERRLALATLRESEARYRALLRHYPDGAVFLVDHGLRFLVADGQALAAAGLDAGGLVGRTLREALPPAAADALEPYYRGALGGAECHFTARERGRVYACDAVPVRAADGGVVGGMVVARDVTERHAAEERLALALEATEDGVWDWNLETGQVHFSPRCSTMLGHEPGHVEPNTGTLDAAVHPDDRAARNAALDAHLRGDTPQYVSEHRIRMRTGGHVWVLDRGKVVARDALGRPLRMVGAQSDLTARRAADAALEREAHLRQSLFEASADCVKLLALDGRVQAINESGLRLLEAERAATLEGVELAALWSEPGATRLREAVRTAAAGEGARFQGFCPTHKGTPRWWDVSVSPVRDETGTVTRLLAVSRDVTEVKVAEAAVRESEARLRLALDVAGMIVWDRDLATDRVRHGALVSDDATPHVMADALGTYEAFLAAVHPDDRAAVAQANADAVARRDDFSIEYRVLGAGGRARWNHTFGRAVAGVDGRPVRVVGVTRDVTERRTLEDQLRQAQKMEAVGRLAGGVAHDFNNLLTVISANTAFARQTLAPDAPAVADLAEVEAAAARAADLTTQLLAFSRQQVLAPRHIDLNEVVADVERMLRRVLGADIAVATDLAAGGAPVYADPGQLTQVLMNLAVNARDAMPGGGRLTITTRAVTIGAADVRPGLERGVYVALRVRDTGTGMDAETRARIFEPFFTTKEPGRGTGLGLATVYGIVKQSGGYIDVESGLGAGCTFTVLFPRTATAAEAATTATAAAARATLGAATVLLVEDDAAVRAVVRRMLQGGGYRVLEAERGGAALALAGAHAGSVELVLTDVVMPETDAGAMLAALRAQRPGLPALLMSGYSAEAVATRGALVEGTSLLRKPFTAAALLHRVREVIDGATTAGPPRAR